MNTRPSINWGKGGGSNQQERLKNALNASAYAVRLDNFTDANNLDTLACLALLAGHKEIAKQAVALGEQINPGACTGAQEAMVGANG